MLETESAQLVKQKPKGNAIFTRFRALEPIISVFWAIEARPGEMYLTAAFELNVAILAVTQAPVKYNHESVESGHTGFCVKTVMRGF